MNEPIPFPQRPSYNAGADDDATEVEAAPQQGSITGRLPEVPEMLTGLGDMVQMPLDLLPAETQVHLRAAGREVALLASSLAGPALKGVAMTLNAVAEVLNSYTERHSTSTEREASARRQLVDIEVE